MDNKPMLSVERDLIERAVQAIINTSQMQPALNELRALLDKPVDSNELSLGGSLARAASGLINVLDDETGAWTETEALKRALEDWSMGKPAAQHQGDPVAWSWCPECGCEELHHEEGAHKQCANCHQEWFSDIDYSEVVRGNLRKLKAGQPAPVAVVMPERKPQRITDEYARGWNDYDAEYKRLNGVKYGTSP